MRGMVETFHLLSKSMENKIFETSEIPLHQRKNLGWFTVGDLFARLGSLYLYVNTFSAFDFTKCHFYKPLKIHITISTFAEMLITLQSCMYN